ncbi:MAG: tRNA dihydrouridine synthase DusB [Methylococcales bacterium]|jgi:tRNA-dihydrouridine synthase B|nr:tRNA dihydrouridine synthase DusB [Methylococcales bacterium]
MRIGHYSFQRPIILAPMAGVTDQAFRQLCRAHGADMTVSEMVTAKPDLLGSRKSQLRLVADDPTAPLIVQMMGNEPAAMAKAATYYIEQGADILDINMGCPAKKVCNTAAGSALLKDSKLVSQILTAVVDASTVPVTLKTRTGWDAEHKNIPDIAKIAEDCGIQSLTIHGRTKACGFKGNAEYETIASVVQSANIPVIANGDITTVEKAKHVLEYTKADGLMIGRGAFGKPWFFNQIKTYLATGEQIAAPSQEARSLLIQQHIANIHNLYGEYLGIRIARKHFAWYVQHYANQKALRQRFNPLTTAAQQIALIKIIFAEDIMEDIAA